MSNAIVVVVATTAAACSDRRSVERFLPKRYAYVSFNPIGHWRWHRSRTACNSAKREYSCMNEKKKKNNDDECINCKRLALKMQIYCWQMKLGASNGRELHTRICIEYRCRIVHEPFNCVSNILNTNMLQLQNNTNNENTISIIV